MESKLNVPDIDSPPQGLPLASRIRIARDLRAMTQAEVVGAMRSPISSAALSQIEAGKVRPSAPTLRDLAEALDVPIEFFYVQWPGALDDDGPVGYFRDLRATPAAQRRRALALAALLNDLVAAIEHYVRLPPVDVPQRPMRVDARRAEIEDAAAEVRRTWQLGNEPIPHVIRAIEKHGVPVARIAMGHESVDAFAVPSRRRPLILLTDDKGSYVRSRFDASHELGHLVMHDHRRERDRTVEAQAHVFASAFLLPESMALDELPKRLDRDAWPAFAQLKRRWGISIGGLIRRARDLHRFSEDDYRTAMKYMSAKGWRREEPGDRQMGPPEAPLLLERSLRRIEVERNIVPEALIESAHLPLIDTLDLVKASRDSRPIIEL